MKNKWYDIRVIPYKNKASDAEIVIYDDIGGWGITASDFKKSYDAIKDVNNIKVLINSPGGSVFDGIAIYNILSSHKGSVLSPRL